MDIVLDVLSERGFFVTAHKETRTIPVKVDLKTGDIISESMSEWVFLIRFKRSVIRMDSDLLPLNHMH